MVEEIFRRIDHLKFGTVIKGVLDAGIFPQSIDSRSDVFGDSSIIRVL
jgi:hypothetical protein